MNKKSFLLKIVGILFMLVPFLLNYYSLVRILFIFLGIVVFSINFLFSKKNKVLKIILSFILFLVLTYSFDYLFVFYFKNIPIFAYQHKASDTIFTYDSPLYRVYSCNGENTIDTLYKRNYFCESLEPIDINDFLTNDTNRYKKYHSKFVTIKGKVSEVFGNDYLLLNPYEQKENNIVGELTFNKNKGIKVINNQGNLKFYNHYEIYDNVLVTGKVTKKVDNTVILEDAKIEVVNNFDNFTVELKETKSCKGIRNKITTVGEYTFYSECLDKIYVSFDSDTVYDILMALETQKLTLDKWINNGTKSEKNNQELYKFKEYNLLKCNDLNTILIGNKKLGFNSNFCKKEE